MADRIKWIDECKGIGIVAVVLGHLAISYNSTGIYAEHSAALEKMISVIYSFHMPLFFLLSGYVFYMAYLKKIEEKESKDKLKNKLLDSIWIFLVFSVCMWVLQYAFARSKPSINSLPMLLIRPKAPYWYLWVLNIYYVLFCILWKKFKPGVLLAIMFCVSIVSTLIPMDSIESPKNVFFYSLPYMTGIYMAYLGYPQKQNKKVPIACAIMAAAGIICAIARGKGVLQIELAGPVFAEAIVVVLVYIVYSMGGGFLMKRGGILWKYS